MMITVMTMIMFMMTMRMKTIICDVINKSRINVEVVVTMQIELVYITAQSKVHCSALIMKSSFIELENIFLNFTSVVVYQ